MEAEHTFTTYDFWKNTIHTVESAYCWLKIYEGKNYELVDKSVACLRELIAHGKDYEAMKKYNSSSSSSSSSSNATAAVTTTTTTSTASLPLTTTTVRQAITHGWKKQLYNTPPPVSYDLERNWEQVNQNTIKVQHTNGTTTLCIAITKAEELDQVVEDIYTAKSIAVDCEFLGQKNALPELKLLQIGVSKDKGYAIQVDLIGQEAITNKLKAVFEDEKLDIVGWSFRGDALAIESYFKQMELSPILDLQAKLKPIAVETLNLGAAMNKYASDWYGNEEFQKAKQYGSQFLFTGENCIWLSSPLPPRALVYACYDVLSLIALHEATSQYSHNEKCYWPYTVISDSSPKAVERWHRQRAKGINGGNGVGMVNIVKSGGSSSGNYCRKNGKGKTFSSFSSSPFDDDVPDYVVPTTVSTKDDGYDDNDIRYKRELQKAIEMSVKETRVEPQQRNGESSSYTTSTTTGGDRIVSEEQLNLSDIAAEFNDIPFKSHHFASRGDNNDDSGSYDNQNYTQQDEEQVQNVESNWGLEDLHYQSFNNKYASWPTTTTEQEEAKAQEAPTPLPALNTSNAPSSWSSTEQQVTASPTARTITLSSVSPILSPKSPLIQHKEQQEQQQQMGPVPLSSPFLDKPLYKPPVQAGSHSTSFSNHVKDTITGGWNNNASPNLSQWVDRSKKPPTNQQPQRKWANLQQRGKSQQPSNQWNNNSANVTTPNTTQNSTYIKSPTRPFSQKLPNTSTATRPRPVSGSYQQQPQGIPLSSTLSATAPSWISPQESQAHPQLQPQQQSFKPDKVKYTNEFKNRITMNGQQSASFTWSKPEKGQMSTATWNSFASNSVNDWKKGKDTELDAILSAEAVAAAAAVTSTTTTTVETVNFNTSPSNYTQGGQIGDRNTGQMHNNNNSEEDNWTRQEERPDTMVMPMNHIPIRTVFTGPRVINPNDIDFGSDDEDEDEDDEDGKDNDSDDSGNQDDVLDFPRASNANTAAVPILQEDQFPSVEELPTFIDAKYLYSGGGNNGYLNMLKLSKPEHLDMIEIPTDEDYTVTVCYHFINRNVGIELKALQLYLSTGASYTAIIEQACLLRDRHLIKATKFGRLLTEPTIKRICWCPDFIEKEMEIKLGFSLGPCIDLAQFANHDRPDSEILSFSDATDFYLRDWKDLDQYKDAKSDFDLTKTKKFSATSWDREKLPDNVLVYCAMQGLAAYQVYVELRNMLNPDERDHFYPSAA